MIKRERKPVVITRRSFGPTAFNAVTVRYTRRMVSTPDDRIFYLAPDFMTDVEALRHALAP